LRVASRDVQLSSGTFHKLNAKDANNYQGQTYDSIIEETVKASQQDFLEAGISLDYLETLRTVSTRSTSVPKRDLVDNVDMAIQAHCLKSRCFPLGATFVTGTRSTDSAGAIAADIL